MRSVMPLAEYHRLGERRGGLAGAGPRGLGGRGRGPGRLDGRWCRRRAQGQGGRCRSQQGRRHQGRQQAAARNAGPQAVGEGNQYLEAWGSSILKCAPGWSGIRVMLPPCAAMYS